MNTLQRPLFDAPMPMVEGSGITSMAMDEAAGEQIGAELTAAVAQGVADTENAIDAADDNVGIMNALRGKQASEEEYRTELAGYVGRKDANATPDSVLALVQPTMAMIELGDAPMGGIADMAAPSTFGVEEEIFGKLPVQKLNVGGEVQGNTSGIIQALAQQRLANLRQPLQQRFENIQAQQQTFLPTAEEIQQAYAVQQPSTMQNLLAVGAPFVQGLLAPSQQGGGINAALSLASQAAAKQIAQQRALEQQAKQKTQQALMQQRITAGQSALEAALGQEEKDLDRLQALQEARLKGSTTGGKNYEYQLTLQKYYDAKEKFGENSPEAKDQLLRLQKLRQLSATPEDLERLKLEIAILGGDIEAAKPLLETFSGYQKDYSTTLSTLRLIQQAKQLSADADIVKGSEAQLKFKNTIEQIATLTGFTKLPSIVNAALGDTEKTEDYRKRRASMFALGSVQAQLVIKYVNNFPGNLNETEVNIARKVASGVDVTPDEYAKLEEAFKKVLADQKEIAEAVSQERKAYFGKPLIERGGLPYLVENIQTRIDAINKDRAERILANDATPANLVPDDTDQPLNISFGANPESQAARAASLFTSVGERFAALNIRDEDRNSEFLLENENAQERFVNSIINTQSGKRGFKISEADVDTRRAAYRALIQAMQGIAELPSQFTVRDMKYGAPTKNTIIAAAKRLLERLGDA